MDILYRIIPRHAYPYYSLPILPEIIFDEKQLETISTFIIRNASAYSYVKDMESAQSFIVTQILGDSSI